VRCSFVDHSFLAGRCRFLARDESSKLPDIGITLFSDVGGEVPQHYKHSSRTFLGEPSSGSNKRATPQATSPPFIFPQNASMSAPPPEGLADVDYITFAEMEQHDQFQRACPDWRTEYLSSNGHRWLTNDLHPAFAEERFNKGFNHQETLLARQFASQLLSVDFNSRFWWALFFGKTMYDEDLEDRVARGANIHISTDFGPLQDQSYKVDTLTKIDEARTPGGKLCLVDPPPCRLQPEELTTQQYLKTGAYVLALAQHVRYVVWPNANGIQCFTAWYARAVDPYPGSPSIIRIDPEELRMHSIAMQGDMISQAWAFISLGFELVQSLAHAAVGFARSGPECNWDNDYEFDAEEKMSAEIRMLESCTFGGALRKEHDSSSIYHYTLDGALGVPGLWFAYSDFAGTSLEDMIGDQEDDPGEVAESEDGPFYHREWQVPFAWLFEVLTDHFWGVKVVFKGQSALEPPKEVGYVMSRDGERKYGPLHSMEIRDGVIPDGWSMLPRSYILVSHALHHDAAGAIMFGGFGQARMALNIAEDQRRPKSEGSRVTDDTSMESISGEDSEDASMEDVSDEDDGGLSIEEDDE
jgi:hypothetical protein